METPKKSIPVKPLPPKLLYFIKKYQNTDRWGQPLIPKIIKIDKDDWS